MRTFSEVLDKLSEKIQARVASIKSMGDRHLALGFVTPIFLTVVYLFSSSVYSVAQDKISWVMLGMMSLFLAFDGGFYVGQLDFLSNRELSMPMRDGKAKLWCYLHAQWCLAVGCISLLLAFNSFAAAFAVQAFGWVGAALIMKRIFYWGAARWSVYLTAVYHIRLIMMLILIASCWNNS